MASKYRRRDRDFEYMGWIKQQPCLLYGADGAGDCSPGWVEADHAGTRPYGQKADDTTCIPLCSRHHRDRTDRSGFFRGKTKDWHREWCDSAITVMRDRYEAHKGGMELF